MTQPQLGTITQWAYIGIWKIRKLTLKTIIQKQQFKDNVNC